MCPFLGPLNANPRTLGMKPQISIEPPYHPALGPVYCPDRAIKLINEQKKKKQKISGCADFPGLK